MLANGQMTRIGGMAPTYKEGEFGASTSGTVKRPEVSEWVERAETSIKITEGLVAMLLDRLSPVLSVVAQKTNQASSQVPTSTHYGGRLSSHTGRIESINQALHEILDQLEV
jgi:hypothetical protein